MKGIWKPQVRGEAAKDRFHFQTETMTRKGTQTTTSELSDTLERSLALQLRKLNCGERMRISLWLSLISMPPLLPSPVACRTPLIHRPSVAPRRAATSRFISDQSCARAKEGWRLNMLTAWGISENRNSNARESRGVVNKIVLVSRAIQRSRN